MNCFQVIVLGASLMGFAGGKTAEGITEQPETLTLDKTTYRTLEISLY